MLGGAERQAVVNIRGLRRLGLDVLPVVGPADALPRALEDGGIPDYLYLPDFFHPPHTPYHTGRARLHTWVARATSARDFVSTRRELRRILRDRRTEVVIASRIYAWLLATPIARELGVPIVWRAGGAANSRAERAALAIFCSMYPPDALVCNSQAVDDSVAAAIGAGSSVIIHNGVDAERFDANRVGPGLRHELGIPADAPVVAMVARPRPLKNFEMLAEAMVQVVRELPSARLLIAGDTEKRPDWAPYGWRQYYERHFAALGLGSCTTFLGHRDDVERVYACADVAVLTSHGEGQPNAVIEAMSMSRPLVVNGVSALADLVEDGVQGFVSPQDDARAFAERLVALLRDPSLRARMGAAGRRVVTERYSEERAAMQWRDVLYGVTGTAIPAPAMAPRSAAAGR
jgi:glycosyltransferase involved in cell wall biosynthesis